MNKVVDIYIPLDAKPVCNETVWPVAKKQLGNICQIIHIFMHEHMTYMFYTSIGIPREIRYTVSKDLFEWSHPSDELLFALSNEHTDNMKNKDPIVFRYQGQWIMVYISIVRQSKRF